MFLRQKWYKKNGVFLYSTVETGGWPKANKNNVCFVFFVFFVYRTIKNLYLNIFFFKKNA